MRIFFAFLLLPALAWGQAPLESPRPQKKDPRAPVVRKVPSAGETARKENRQADKVSKTMKKRRGKPVDNSIQNQR